MKKILVFITLLGVLTGCSKSEYDSRINSVNPSTSSTSSSVTCYCGARTQSGGTCKRVVTCGTKCWQHK